MADISVCRVGSQLLNIILPKKVTAFFFLINVEKKIKSLDSVPEMVRVTYVARRFVYTVKE